MNYTRLAREARKLYHALRDENFDAEQAYDITKVCVRDYPIFREMIEKEDHENVIGYLYFIDGSKEPIYKHLCITGNVFEVHTKDDVYRETTYTEYGCFSFMPTIAREFKKYINKNWEVVNTVDHIELIKGENV